MATECLFVSHAILHSPSSPEREFEYLPLRYSMLETENIIENMDRFSDR